MSSIDNRIINMQFNSEKAQASISGMSKALDTLAAKLNFKGAGKGVQSALNGLDPSALGTFNSALDATTTKFLALGTVGVAAIAAMSFRLAQTTSSHRSRTSLVLDAVDIRSRSLRSTGAGATSARFASAFSLRAASTSVATRLRNISISASSHRA